MWGNIKALPCNGSVLLIHRGVRPQTPEPIPIPMRIAVLDDDLLLLEQIKGTLECHQHVCHTFADGTSLLQALRQETFDLLLVDWHLPDMEGTDVVQTVRNAHGMLPPILFINRHSDERGAAEALSRGADDVMSKPLRMGELVARTTALLRRAFPQSMAYG